MNTMQQRVLPGCNASVVAPLLFEYVQRPPDIATHEGGIGPGGCEYLPGQGLYSGTQSRDIIGGEQVLTGIERSHVPVGFGAGRREIQKGGEYWQVPGQFGGRARTQPLS